MAKAFSSQKSEFEAQMKNFRQEKEEAVKTKDMLAHVQTQWTNYERKLNDKRELLITYESKLKQLEEEHMGCIKREMKDRKDIEALQRVVTVETTKHLEKDTLARQLKYEKINLEGNLRQLERSLEKM
mmetsp:Transcript_17849/g.24002  ORF Transcript_17849/g.24002 Transcript_17849/m.24002 type:complete len:128 (-) Transcript_17849:127-510(-)